MQRNKNRVGVIKLACLVAVLSSLCSAKVFAIESGIIDIRPYVSATATYDDNLFRFASEQQAKASGIVSMGDTITTLGAGVNVGVRLSRQQFLLGLGLSESTFDSNKSLDYTGNNLNGNWNWQLGNHLSGVLSYTESETAPGFQERVAAVKNLRTSTRKFGSINWQFHPSWLTFASIEQSTSDNSSVQSKVLDTETSAVETGVQYESSASTVVRVAYRDTETNYPNRTGFSLIQLGGTNNQRQISTNVSWSPTRLTKINAFLAFNDLEYPGNSARNFSGDSENLGVDYALTSNTNLSLSLFRDISALQGLISTFVEATGFSVRPSWQATSKILLGGSLEYRDSAYIGSKGVYAPNIERQDQNRKISTYLNYQATRKLLLQTNLSVDNRSSNVSTFDYRDNTLSATLRYDF